MNREKLIRILAKDARIGGPHQAAAALAAIEEAIGGELQRGRPVCLDRFGTFATVLRTTDAPSAEVGKPGPPRVHKVPIFRAATELRSRVNGIAPTAEQRTA
ncbi:HU family DNA-binding protein [Streptacidiphilus rugosus]|uniref:HU family DNA-binding protein n=1 Tax=Streptacidiphilus rugosus TaxID=405783 RepID=UPI0005688D74|nr:HU family DNA-binding protein [Streptacidiphilus rugosus]